MNILITGGTGLIGRSLINALNTENDQITVLTRDIKKASKLLNANIKLISSLSLEDIENQDTIINLAGEPIADKRWSYSQKNKICKSRWDITEKISTYIQQAKNPPSLFISGSAIGMYGRQDNDVIDENFQQFHPEFTHRVCNTWEHFALLAKSSKTRVAILRTGIVLAKKGGALAKMLLPFKLGLGGKISHGKQVMSWIHIEDVIAAIIFIQNTPTLEGAVNITAPNPVSNQVFTSTLAKVLNRPSLITTPAFILKVIFGEMADLLLFGQHVVPNKLQKNGFKFKYPIIESALSHLIQK
ncbi:MULTISPECIES: TIGR01777 family oxidoreductase [Thalassotalea]|uniref:TIGR01777 family oxidoreductase n=1 Tax=Thalassotalea castellviae TaxID=3075612 RepID=A0ABU3A5G1_9GAMM|nr:TIGR01777 family oxidoreductase [Thalassotalea sp. W431]MDT0604348.1 TIGR01777 family oxidoreductase [Thalassotalea sp. W431]